MGEGRWHHTPHHTRVMHDSMGHGNTEAQHRTYAQQQHRGKGEASVAAHTHATTKQNDKGDHTTP